MTAALAASGWREIVFDGFKANAWADVPGGIEVSSDGSVSVLFRTVEVDLSRTPALSWKWRVDNAPAPSDLARTSGEDRALAVYVGFPYQPERAGFWESVQRLAVVATEGEDAPGRLLTYVWGGNKPRNTFLRRDGRETVDVIKVMRTPRTPVDTWFAERVDVREDFRAAFGWEAPDPTHIGIVSDSDDTGKPVRGSVIDIAFERR